MKGGGVARDAVTGRWASTDRHGVRHDIQDAFAQVRASKHALLHKLKDHPAVGAAWIELGHGVVFPDCASPRRPLGPDCSPEITMFAGDMAHIGTRIAGMFDYWQSRTARAMRPSPVVFSTLTALLAPAFELRQPLWVVLAEDDRELLRLTEQQFGVLTRLCRLRRVSITGGAGTGKTMLAIRRRGALRPKASACSSPATTGCSRNTSTPARKPWTG